MSVNTLNNLYLKYRNKIAKSIESDQYYQYLFDLISKHGTNTISQTNRIMHKQIDERWLTTIEESIDALDTIINKPRRFIETKESVMPIELVRRISADSVKHLAQNTRYINNIDKNGHVMPSQLLNVTTEESYNLYENRFINTLIQKLVGFIDKRSDVIFWSTGDERFSNLAVNSVVEDDYEEISYSLELKIKNKQSYLDTDNQHREVFKRIDRVRRIVLEFQRSGFAKLMKDTAPVHSPVHRTNLLMKDPNYKKCYALWLFLDHYDNIGYTIDVRESALDFDEEYLYQVYNNLILNYTMFKSLLSDDHRPIDEIPPQRQKIIKPKFIKQIVEEFVDDYNLPDVEIRRVIVEEITKAQLEIERRKKEHEREAARKEKERAKKQAAREREQAKKKAERAKEKVAEAKRLKAEKEREKVQEKRDRIRAREKAKADKIKALEKAKLQKEKDREQAKADKAKALEQVRLEKEKALEKARREKEKAAEKARLEKEKAKEREKARIAKEKAAEKARIAKEKEKAKKAAALEKAKEKEKAKKATVPKKKAVKDTPLPASPTPDSGNGEQQ